MYGAARIGSDKVLGRSTGEVPDPHTVPHSRPQPKAAGRGRGTQPVAFNAGGKRTGVTDQARDVQSVWRLGAVRVDPVCAAAQQRHRPLRVAPLHVGEADRELRQPLPQLAVLPRRRLPHPLEHLVGMKGVTVVNEPLRLPQRVVRAEHGVLGNPVNPARAMRQRPALSISRTGVAGPSGGVPVTAVHPCMMADGSSVTLGPG